MVFPRPAKRWTAGLPLALLMLVAAAAAAPNAHAQETGTEREEQITLNFQDVDIRALINTVSEVTGKNFIVDPRVKGKVTLVSGGPLNANEIYNVFLSVLDVHNFSAVPSGEIIKIVPSNIVKQQPTPTAYDGDVVANDGQITQVMRLKHASVQELLPILRPLLPPTSHFAAHPPTNTLVFTDTAANVDRLIDIIHRIDVPDRRSSIHVIYLKNARASKMAGVLSQLAASFKRTGEGAQPVDVQVQGEDALNALIINAPDNEFRLLQAVVDQLDIERPLQGDVHVVYLKHAKAMDLVELLGNVTRSRAAQGGGEGAAANAVEQSVQADEANNALVINAPQDVFRTIKNVIDQLDVRREQVYVETIIAEVSSNRAADLGIEWQVNENTDPGLASASTNFSDQTGGLTLGFLNKLIIDITGNIVPDLSVVLRALRTDTDTNILSTPNLVTLENEPAEIVVAREVPFITGQFTTNVGTTTTVDIPDQDVAVNAVNPFQTIERKDVGITLKITPQINAGNTVRLEIEHEISNVSDRPVQGASDIITDKRSIQTTVEVDDGQIIVLGGLIRDDVVGSVEWVPILGKIPLIGALFRRKSKDAIKTNLMIFLQPRIVRTTADLAGPTREKYDFIRAQQEASQKDTQHLIKDGNPPVLPTLEGDR